MGIEQRPTVRRRVLGTNLRRLREERGLLLEDAAQELSCHAAKVSRIESGRSGIRQLDLRVLLDLYGVTDSAAREGWLALARESRQKRWWRALEDQFPQDFLDLIGLEEDVSHCRGFQPAIIDGLLQTEAYATAVIGGGSPGPLGEDGQARLHVRMERQKALTRRDSAALDVWMILGEAALRQEYGGPEVLREQLHHLIELAKLSNVTLQVLPFTAGAYRSGPWPFTIYSFPQPARMEVVLLENHTSHTYLETAQDTGEYGDIFNHLRMAALGAMESQSLIREIAGELSA